MPVLNEADHLEAAVRGILRQDYGGGQELVIALGSSNDGTTQLAQDLAAGDGRIKLVENPANDVPIGLNLAIQATQYPVVIRVDAHAELPTDYTELMVAKLRETDSANVGGVMRAEGTTPIQRAIARAYNSPWGLGGGSYHGARSEGPSDSAYLGVYRREVFEEVGLFDEKMRRAQDWELNDRIRRAGYQIWFTPEVEVIYWPRPTLAKLRLQMFATGVWRGHLVRKQGRSPLRYLAPPLLVLGLLVSFLLGLRGLAGHKPAAVTASVLPFSYVTGLSVASAQMKPDTLADCCLNALVLSVIHLSWGAGFIRGWVSGAEQTVDASRRS
jgi:glycosyltransferase involved in cell wall biosynthesis